MPFYIDDFTAKSPNIHSPCSSASSSLPSTSRHLHNSASASTIVCLHSSTSSSSITNVISEISTLSCSDLQLSFPTLPSEEDDWRQFGYLLDSQREWAANLEADDPLQMFSNGSHIVKRSNSMPTASVCSSLDVELSSSVDASENAPSDATMQLTSSGSPDADAPPPAHEKMDVDDSEPIAHRTRLSSITNQRKPPCFTSADDSGATAKRRRCDETERATADEPWWLNKFLPECHQPLDESGQVVRTKRTTTPPTPVVELCDPRFISLGGSTHSPKREVATPADNNNKEEAAIEEREVGREVFKTVSPRRTPRHRVKSETSTGSEADRRSPIKFSAEPVESGSTLASRSSRKRTAMSPVGPGSPTPVPPKVCPCGRAVTAKKPHLQCYGCGRSFHRECVDWRNGGMTSPSKEWMCVECLEATQKPLFCVCRKPYDGRFYVACDGCDEWFHPDCIGTTEGAVATVEAFYCPSCAAPPSMRGASATSKTKNRRKHH